MIEHVYNERKLLAKFIVVGFCGFVINYIVLRVSSGSLNINKVLSEVIAAAFALQVTFFLNDRWTYHVVDADEMLKLKLWTRYGAYITTNTLGSLMTVIMFAVFSPHMERLIALGLAAVAAMVWNYCMNRIFIWRHTAIRKIDKKKQ